LNEPQFGAACAAMIFGCR